MDLAVDETTYRVDLTRKGDRWVLTVDGRSRELEVIRRGDGHLVLRHEGRTLHLRVARSPRGTWVGLPGRTFMIETVTGRRAGAAHRHGPVESPITGRVIRVLVEEGQLVEARQPLAVVEAMKMENEVLAPAAGRVANIRVAVGGPIDMGAPLLDVLAVEDASAAG